MLSIKNFIMTIIKIDIIFKKGGIFLPDIILKKARHLEGKLDIHGAKNSALPIIAATLLSDTPSYLKSIPELTDILNMFEILKSLGCKIEEENGIYKISPEKITTLKSSYDMTSKLRASFLISGPLLAKYKSVRISYPGGCAIGSRPVDLHLKGFHSLGAKIEKKHGFIDISCDKLRGAKIYLDFPSVGATENIMMASTLAEGETIIENAAVEPEIVDLANFLSSMGAEVIGAGTDTIKVRGVKKLKGCEHTVIPDRIEAGTYMVAAAITKGDVTINNVICDHLRPVCAKFKEIGVNIIEKPDSIRVICENPLKATDIKTLPYPGFPTDMQAQFASLFSCIKGTSIITETIFENRFQHIGELKRMGANIRIDGRCAVIEGGRLSGTTVSATDLRAGAALVLAGLNADGETIIKNSHYITRGYFNFVDNLNSLGANIKYLE